MAALIGLKLTASQGDIFFDYYFTVLSNMLLSTRLRKGRIPISPKFDYMPAVGHLPIRCRCTRRGDTQETMNQKVLDAIGNNKRGMITLGGFGGYVTVGFDHTIQNVEGLRDFRVLGNAFMQMPIPIRMLQRAEAVNPG